MTEWIKFAKVGDKVTPLSAGHWEEPLFGEACPEFGAVYTIRQILAEPGGIYFRLAEIVNDVRHYCDGKEEIAFEATGFRPVQPRKTDISWAHEILRKVGNPLEEVA